jgi:hypothetical protein
MPTRTVLAALAAVAAIAVGVGVFVGGQDGRAEVPGTVVRAPGEAVLDSSGAALVEPPGTRARFAAVMDSARALGLTGAPIGVVMQRVGTLFRGAPYLTGSLDAPALADTTGTVGEPLVVRLDGFDCVTFVETMLAMARGLARGDASYDGFRARLAEVRYRGGGPPGYCGRLHYFSEWVADNDRRRLVEDLTLTLGGEPVSAAPTFMGTHRDAYARLAPTRATGDSLFACVRAIEDTLAAREHAVYAVMQDDLRAVYDRLRPGDIIGLVTSIDGLDVAHTGLAYRHADGGIGLLHASTSGGVKVSPDLHRYVANIGHQVGILVARPLSPHPDSG